MILYIIFSALVFFFITYLFYDTMNKQTNAKQNLSTGIEARKKEAVFITGCDTGFGYSLVLHNLQASNVEHDHRILIAGCYYPGGSSEGINTYFTKSKQFNRNIVEKKNIFFIVPNF